MTDAAVVARAQDYREQLHVLAAQLQAAQRASDRAKQLECLQLKLDLLTGLYRADEQLGTRRYKLAELQAHIYSLQGHDEAALREIEQAICVRGESYPAAERLLARLEGRTSFPASPDGHHLQGVTGWLGLYVLGLILTIILLLVSFLSTADSFGTFHSIHATMASVYSTIAPLFWYDLLCEVVLIGLGIFTLIALLQRRHSAKNLAIGFMLLLAVFSYIDFGLAGHVTRAFSGLDFGSLISDSATSVGRNIVYALIWIPYFLISRRVKRTLTR